MRSRFKRSASARAAAARLSVMFWPRIVSHSLIFIGVASGLPVSGSVVSSGSSGLRLPMRSSSVAAASGFRWNVRPPTVTASVGSGCEAATIFSICARRYSSSSRCFSAFWFAARRSRARWNTRAPSFASSAPPEASAPLNRCTPVGGPGSATSDSAMERLTFPASSRIRLTTSEAMSETAMTASYDGRRASDSPAVESSFM